MSRTKIAPQAFTKDTLTKAYEWLTSQPEPIQLQATSADVLVSIYLRALRHGESSLTPLKPASKVFKEEAPVSMQHFQSDLKDLASGLKEFESDVLLPTDLPPASLAPTEDIAPTQQLTTTQNFGATMTERVLEVRSEASTFQNLDTKSQEIAQQIQKRFNLSSEIEAVRMLMVLGYEHIKKTFPDL